MCLSKPGISASLNLQYSKQVGHMEDIKTCSIRIGNNVLYVRLKGSDKINICGNY